MPNNPPSAPEDRRWAHLIRHQYKPGHRSNNGRRIDPEVKKLLIEHSTLAANTLCDIVRNRRTSPEARLRAAIALLDRVHGKAGQPLDDETRGRMQIQLEGLLNEWAR